MSQIGRLGPAMSDHTPDLVLTLLGPVTLQWQGAPVARLSHPCRALLACVALSPRLSCSRDQLAAIIWGDINEVRAKRNLRHAVFQLRNALPSHALGAIIVERKKIGFSEHRIQVDALEVLAQMEAGQIPDRAALADLDQLLAGLEQTRETLAIWGRARQRDFRERVQFGLHALLDQVSAANAERAALALLQLDRSDEVAARHLIAQAHAQGDSGRALRVYKDLWDHLDTEFDTEPSAATQKLIVAIKSEPAEPSTKAVKASAPAQPPSVRVAPFAALRQPSVEAVALRDEIIARLARFRELRVLDGAIATKVETDYQLDPTWQSGPEGSRLVITLKRTSNGSAVWSYFNQDTTDEFGTLPSTVAGSVASACGVEISRARLAEILGGVPRRDAVDEWLLGQSYIQRLERPDWEKAEQCFVRAQRLDPNFSKALSSLAQVSNVRHLVSPGEMPDMSKLREGSRLAAAAIRADPLDGQAYSAQAWAACMQRHYGHAEAAFAQALRLCPDDPYVVLSSALGAAFSGRQEDAAEGVERYETEGWTTSSLFLTYRSNVRFLAGDLDGCIADVLAADGGPINLPAWAAAAMALQGDMKGAAEAWSAFEERAQGRAPEGPQPSRSALLDWFLASFPLRLARDQTRLATGARRALTALEQLRGTA